MEIIYLIIIFVLAITFSNVVNRLFPIIPLPIIQIIFGIIVGMTPFSQEIVFEPEIFLVMIIAPLLFREGEHADIKALTKDFEMILFLAFAGVMITLVSVGWVMHLVMPALPIAACFALGAALGPTDAVAVSSLSEKINIPKRVMSILSGEGLLNDASGVTAFQFALVALTTGAFSVINAGFTLLISSVGGALVGFILVMLKRQIAQILEKTAAKDVTGYLLLELLLPFVAYMVSELLGVSGIIAAVIAGVMQASSFKKVSLFEAELSSVSESTWGTITFSLNALVFLFLGVEIAQVFSPIWNSQTYSNLYLLFIIIAIGVTLFVARFCSIFLIFLLKKGFKSISNLFNEILILTFGGVKGTVSLATIFILPLAINGENFEYRALLLFITACVILFTLIGAIVVLPFLTDNETEEAINLNEIELLRDVINQLSEKNQSDPHVAMNVVIENYQDRMKEIYTASLPSEKRQDIQELRALVVSIEHDGLEESFKQKQIGMDGYRLYERLISRMERSITRQLLSIIGFWLLFVRQVLYIFLHPKMVFNREEEGMSVQRALQVDEIDNIRKVFIHNTEVILKSLDNLRGVYDDDLIEFFIDGRLQLTQKLEEDNLINSFIVQSQSDYIKELLIGYQEERKMIDLYEMSGKLTPEEANICRKNVNLLESFSINDTSTVFPFKKIMRKVNRYSNEEES